MNKNLNNIEFLRKLAFTDLLTKCYNRNWLKYCYDSTLNASTYYLFIDIKNLRGINNDSGYLHGDTTLKNTGIYLKKFGDVVRLGGDEFLVICKNEDIYLKALSYKYKKFHITGVKSCSPITRIIEKLDKKLKK